MTNVELSNVLGHYELRLADIVEVRLSDAQEDLFRNLMKTECDKYYFTTADEIKTLGVKFGTNELADNIANHTPKILSENTDKLILRNKYKEIMTVQL